MKRLFCLLMSLALLLCLFPAVVSAAEGEAMSLTWSQGTYYDNTINPNLVSRKYTVIDVNPGDVVTFDYPTANWAIYVYYADANGSFGYVTSKQGANETFVVQEINGRTPTQLRLTAFHRSGSNVTITDELWATFDVVISKTGMELEPTSNIFTFATQNFGLWNDGVNQGVAADQVEARAAAWQAVMEKHGVDLLVGQEWLPYLDSDKTVSANEKVFGNDYPYMYGNSTSTYDGKNIISRTPLSNISYNTMVSNVGRRYAKAYTIIGGKTVCIIDAHLSFEEDINVNRKEEMVELLNLAQTEKYAIIAGDFNVFTADEFEIFEEAGYSLANAGAFGEFNTWPNLGRNPTADVNRVIDNIIVSPGIRINSAWVEDTKLSDHALLAAELELLDADEITDNRLLCEHCNQFVEWKPVTATNGGTANAILESGHYYLPQDLPKVNSQFYIGDTTYPSLDVVVDLRGHAVKSTGRVFYARKNSKLTIVDTVGCGTLTGASTGTGGTIYAENSCVLSIYDGSVYNTATPTSDRKGGTIYMETNAKLNLHGGEIYGGKASHGGALYAANTNIVNISGGLISGGTATTAGGGVYVFGGTLTMTDGTITGGQGGSGGGLYLYKATANLNGGTIYGNSGTYGGNVHTAENGTTGCLNVGNVNVYGGTASGGGADYWVSSSGKACLVTKEAAIRDNSGKNVTTTAGDMVLYVNGYYTVHDHDYQSAYTAPTLEADGFTTYTCEGCGDSYVKVDEGTCLHAAIKTQPAATATTAGNQAQFAVAATGEGLSYAWQYQRANGTKWFYTTMEGFNTAELNVTATVARNGYKYRCIITDAYGNQVISEAAALTVTEKQITTSGPADQVAENGKAVFTVAVEGENLTYKWQYQRADGTKWFYTTMEGYATNTLTVTATASRNGYKYRCIVTDAYGNETVSETATLTVE